MSVPGINNLSTLIKRLEAATSRLEDIAVQQHAQPQQPPAGGMASTDRGAPVPPSAPAVDLPASVEAWDDEVKPKIDAFAELSAKVGGNVEIQAKHVVAAFEGVRHTVLVAGSSKKPSGSPSPVFLKLLEPIQKALEETQNAKEKNRADRKLFNHLSAIAEGIPAVGWVTIEPKPGPYVEEMKNAGQFYFNRVIKEFKDTDKVHVEWARSFTATLDAMKAYVMQHHTTGLQWNPRGGDASTFSAPSNAAATGDVPPPPPPAPPVAPAAPPPPPAAAAASGAAAAGGMDAVFGQINQGEGITGGLKKVDPSQMTHKNPALRGQAAPVSAVGGAAGKPAPPKPGSKPGSLKAKKPPKTALEGNKWAVEYHEGNRSIVLEETSIGQTVNVFGCKDSVIHVKGKVNAIQMVSCSKTSILLDTLVSSLELTQSPSFTVQVTGAVPTILIDSCDSGQIYLSQASLHTEIVTAKCSAINVSVPKEGEPEGEYAEIALPEQLRHQVVPGGKGIKSEVVEHSG